MNEINKFEYDKQKINLERFDEIDKIFDEALNSVIYKGERYVNMGMKNSEGKYMYFRTLNEDYKTLVDWYHIPQKQNCKISLTESIGTLYQIDAVIRSASETEFLALLENSVLSEIFDEKYSRKVDEDVYRARVVHGESIVRTYVDVYGVNVHSNFSNNSIQLNIGTYWLSDECDADSARSISFNNYSYSVRLDVEAELNNNNKKDANYSIPILLIDTKEIEELRSTTLNNLFQTIKGEILRGSEVKIRNTANERENIKAARGNRIQQAIKHSPIVAYLSNFQQEIKSQDLFNIHWTGDVENDTIKLHCRIMATKETTKLRKTFWEQIQKFSETVRAYTDHYAAIKGNDYNGNFNDIATIWNVKDNSGQYLRCYIRENAKQEIMDMFDNIDITIDSLLMSFTLSINGIDYSPCDINLAFEQQMLNNFQSDNSNLQHRNQLSLAYLKNKIQEMPKRGRKVVFYRNELNHYVLVNRDGLFFADINYIPKIEERCRLEINRERGYHIPFLQNDIEKGDVLYMIEISIPYNQNDNVKINNSDISIFNRNIGKFIQLREK